MKLVLLIHKLDVVSAYLDMKVLPAVTVPMVLSDRGFNVLVSGQRGLLAFYPLTDRYARRIEAGNKIWIVNNPFTLFIIVLCPENCVAGSFDPLTGCSQCLPGFEGPSCCDCASGFIRQGNQCTGK